MNKKVLVVSDAHIWKTEDNKYWCNTTMHGYSFWTRYLTEFDEVHVVARTNTISHFQVEQQHFIRADGDRIVFIELPFIRGLKGYVVHFFSMHKACKKVISDEGCAVFRLPSIPAYFVLNEYQKLQKPYAVEVIIDPEDEYKMYPLISRVSVNLLRKACLHANGVSYVTKEYLQNKYPSAKSCGYTDKAYFESYYSSIDLKDDFFYRYRDFRNKHKNSIKIIHVANSINNDNKGHRTLLEITKKLVNRGIAVHVTFIGDGDKLNYFQKLSISMGVENNVVFTGYVSDKNVLRQYLLDNELFVFPTRAEGLPRALIEAMATGLPCLSTSVDGIPELLSENYLFDYNDVEGYACKIEELASNNTELQQMSELNISKAKEYEYSIIKTKRDQFYSCLKNAAY